MKSGCRMILQVICQYVSVFCTLSFPVCCCRGLPSSPEKEGSIGLDFSGNLVLRRSVRQGGHEKRQFHLCERGGKSVSAAA